MKSFIMLACLVAIALWGTVAQAFDKVVYGTDGRQEVFQAPTQMGEWARSTAAMIPIHALKKNGSNFELKGYSTLKDDYELCSSELFVAQPTAANCSGFLVAPDVLVTAGHCVQNNSDCSSNYWVFDYKMMNADAFKNTFTSAEVYKCTSIVARELNNKTKNDFAIIKLDRVVTGRAPLKFRTSGKVSEKADLVVIGNPSGIPTKITEGGTMRTNTNPVYFVANLDTFAGNSGSAVIDTQSGLVEGILVRGENDYVADEARQCSVVNVCEEGQCRGEDVTRITNLANFLKPVKK